MAKDAYIRNLRRQLADKGRMLALSLDGPARLDADSVRAMAKAAGGRITVVRPDGKVLADSEANAAGMENHRTRPELIEAFRGRRDGASAAASRSASIFCTSPFPGPAPFPAERFASPCRSRKSTGR